jgi:hypothetical protein
VREDCQWTADKVGYPVPCPVFLPPESTPSLAPFAESIGPQAARFLSPGIEKRSRRWVFLNVSFPTRGMPSGLEAGALGSGQGHLEMFVAPKPVPDIGRFVSGDLGRPHEFVPRGTASVDAVTGRWVGVSDGAFGHHLVLVWIKGGRTYGLGFHGRGRASRELGLAVARTLEPVPPR